MRTVCLYVLTLSLLLIGGYRFFFGSEQDSAPTYNVSAHVAKFHQANIFEKQYASPRLRAALPSQDQKDEVQLEDEDDDAVSARKMLLAKYFVTLVFASFLFFFYKLYKDLIDTYQERYALDPGKYISQRALRI